MIGVTMTDAQGFVAEFLRADTLFTEGKFLESGRLYVSALTHGGNLPNGVYIAAAISYAMAGRHDSAIALIDQGVLRGFNQLEVLQKDSSLVSLRSDPQWASHFEQWKKSAEKTAKKLNKPLQEDLLQMAAADQQVRKSLPRLNDSTDTKTIAKALQQVDPQNAARMWEILRQYGWPGYSLVGQDGAHDAWLLVQHADADPRLQDTALTLLSRAAAKGDASQSDLAYLTDRVLTNKGKQQIFGTQTHWENTLSRFVPYPIGDEANVDVRREKVGLEPMAEYLRFLMKMYKGSAGKN